jgi:tripartite-type tricarboxylate transporter receptor subunit TctC
MGAAIQAILYTDLQPGDLYMVNRKQTNHIPKGGNVMWGRASLFIVAMIFVGSISVQPALGKEYPTKAIEILCPFTAGGTADLLSRLVANTASKYLGQPVVVVNKPGGGGSVAAADVISSKPDGYRIVQLPTNFFSATIYTQKVPFGPNDIIPIANFMAYKEGIMVKGDSPWKTLNDLLDYGKKNPDKLRWGHPSRGSPLFMNTLLIFRKAGVRAIEVPYMGSAEVLNALLGGHLDAAGQSYGVIRDHVKTGNVRYVATFGDRRYTDPANVPTAAELGFPEASKTISYVGMYAHKDTPEQIRNILFDAFKKTFDDPEFKKGFGNFGEEPAFGGPEFMREAVKKSSEVNIPMLKEFGLYTGK